MTNHSREKRMQNIITSILLVILAAGRALASDSWTSSSAVPAFPVASACELDLSAEMFGGVAEACGRGEKLDRSRCCPVLAAWLFAAHARSAFRFRASSTPEPLDADISPLMPETDSKRCSDVLQTALDERNIVLPRPNATCDAALCFCGVHLHAIGSLSCAAPFRQSNEAFKPAGYVRKLERDCRNASYSGCTRCLNSILKLRAAGGGERGAKLMDRDCRLMGLTWLLGRNKTAYIPTVSAVLRAILYSDHAPISPYRCSPDQEDMPLAVDSIQVQRAAAVGFSSDSYSAPWIMLYSLLILSAAVQLVL